jgi:hypothetical protein
VGGERTSMIQYFNGGNGPFAECPVCRKLNDKYRQRSWRQHF